MVALIVGTELDDNSIRQVSNDIQRRFDRLGQDLGGDFMSDFADGAASNAPKVQKALDRAADATGRLRTEQEKLDALTSSGEQSRTRVVSQSERVAKARRDEARAYREAADAAQDYGQAGQQAGGSFMSGLGAGTAGAGGVGGDAAGEFVGGFAASSALARLGAVGGPIGLALAGAAVLGVTAGKQLGDAIAEGLATIQLQDRFQASMGLDEASMSEYAKAAGRAYANNFGTTPADNLATAQSALRSGIIDTDATDAEVQTVIEQLQGLSMTTDATTAELARSVTTMMRTGLAGSASEATDIIAAGFQSGLDVSGDWLDTIHEYSTQFRKLGLDAGDVLTLLSQGLQGGARDTDKVADSLAEFSKLAINGTASTAEGFAALGFNADEMGQRFAAGGESARGALDATFQALARIDDPMRQALAWQRLFGTQFEDMGDAVNQFDMSKVSEEFDNLTGTSERATKAATDNWTSEWEKATRTIEQRFADFKTSFADWATNLPVIRDLPGMLGYLAGPGLPEVDNTGLRVDDTSAPRDPNPLGTPSVTDLLIPGGTAPQAPERFSLPMSPSAADAAAPTPSTDNPLADILGSGPGAPPALPPPVAGTPTPILTDTEAQVQRDAESSAADEKVVIDPARYSLDAVPITGLGDMPVELSGAGPMMPTQSPVSQGPDGPGYFEVDPQAIFDAETASISQRQSVENARLRLLELEAEGTATAGEINAARTAVQLAERGYMSQMQKLAEAHQGTWQKLEDTAASFTSGMEGIGAALDADLGISDGLPAVADNLVRFVASLAAAPLLGQLSAIKDAAGDEGSGLFGIAASQGLLGERFMPSREEPLGYAASPMGPQAWQPGVPGVASYGSANPNASAMMALAQSADGGSYSWGGSDLANGLADCSGAVSDLVEMLDTGTTTPGRLFTTHNAGDVLSGMGATRGFVPGNLNVGVSHAGVGHMAATLPNGVAFEAGGGTGGIAYGGPAAGADDPQFTEQWSLPVGGPAAPSMPSLYSPQNTSPALTSPIPSQTPGGGGGPLPGLPGALPGFGGGGSTLPGTGMPGAAPFGATPGAMPGAGQPGRPEIGSSVIAGQTPQGVQGAGSGMTGAIGGLPLAGIQAAASGLDLLAPGAGAAANLGIQLANRTIGFAGQQAGNAVAGLFETFSLSGSGGMTDPMKTLPGRVLAGIAGARPAMPNTAGQSQQPQSQGQQQQNPQQGQGGGPMVNIENVNQAPGQEPDSVANGVADQFRSAEVSSGFPR